MKNILLIFGFAILSTTLSAQFHPSEEGLIIMVSDGTLNGRNSKMTPKGEIPTSYGMEGSQKAAPSGGLAFTDPIRSLGMADCIQAAAFLERPTYGLLGFMLIFSVNDSIGGQQGTHTAGGKTYQGVYRLVKQKISLSEEIPKGMTPYRIQGTFFILGIS